MQRGLLRPMKRPPTEHKIWGVELFTTGKLALIVALVLLSIFVLLKPIQPPGRSDFDEELGTDDWMGWAKIAWRYFQPGVALNPTTGLHYATPGWHRFTDWDLGVYISAIIDAEKIGILPRDGPWGSTYRINKIMDFLQRRELIPENVSYLWYDSRNGSPARDLSNQTTNVSDLGFFLIALHALKTYRPEYSSTIDYIVHTRENITRLASDPVACRTTGGIYKWYCRPRVQALRLRHLPARPRRAQHLKGNPRRA